MYNGQIIFQPQSNLIDDMVVLVNNVGFGFILKLVQSGQKQLGQFHGCINLGSRNVAGVDYGED